MWDESSAGLWRELQVSLEVVSDAPILTLSAPSTAAAVARVLSSLTDPFYVGSVREETVEVFV